jgi:hypothetical protein
VARRVDQYDRGLRGEPLLVSLSVVSLCREETIRDEIRLNRR